MPTIELEQRGVTVTILREKFQAINLGGTADVNQFKNKYVGSEKSSEKSSEKIINEIARDASITTAQLARILSISERAVAKHLKKLQETGKIRRIGSDKGGHWEVIDIKSRF